MAAAVGPGAGGVQAIEPNGQVHKFEHYSEYAEALAAGKVSADAKIIGRQPNYRHGNNLYSERDAGFTQRAFGNPPMYKPEFWQRVQYLDENGNKEDTTFSCFPPGVPRLGPADADHPDAEGRRPSLQQQKHVARDPDRRPAA